MLVVGSMKKRTPRDTSCRRVSPLSNVRPASQNGKSRPSEMSVNAGLAPLIDPEWDIT